MLTKRSQARRRGTVRQSGSSGAIAAVDTKSLPDARVSGSSIPRLIAAARNLEGAEIAPREAFLLSRIDGQLNAGDLADLTGIPEREVLTTLERLAKIGLVQLTTP